VAIKVLTVEEAKKLGPPSEADRERLATALRLAAESRAAVLAAAGTLITSHEFARLWAELDAEDEIDLAPGTAK
jgi:hypothetical protein